MICQVSVEAIAKGLGQFSAVIAAYFLYVFDIPRKSRSVC